MMTLGTISVSAHAATVQVMIENLAYSPADTTAKIGDTVEWINKDIVAHTATARNGDWDINIDVKESARLSLKKTGAIEYYCRFHPNMKGKITITP